MTQSETSFQTLFHLIGSARKALILNVLQKVRAAKREHALRIKHCKSKYYLSRFQSFDISSRVLPFVSGTSFHTKSAARMQITP